MMYVFVCTVFTVILYLVLLFLDSLRKKKGEEELSFELTPEEFYKALNFMLMYGIIDISDYHNIELKSLTYLKG